MGNKVMVEGTYQNGLLATDERCLEQKKKENYTTKRYQGRLFKKVYKPNEGYKQKDGSHSLVLQRCVYVV
jgi:hypothetical protein